MLIFFDYLFYGVQKFYGKNKDSGPGLSALIVITLTQILNILTVYVLYCLITQTKVNISKLIAVVIYLSVLILNVKRYSRLDLEKLKEKWENKNEKQKTTIRAFVVLYVFLSFALGIGLAIYVGNRNN
jgi:formate-dependent nitrite reductase membrane component NrfD